MLDKKSVLTRKIIKIISFTKKDFLIVIKLTFFLINSGNQELIHHIQCFGYMFCHPNDNEFYSLSVSNIFYSTIHLYIRYDFTQSQYFQVVK